MGTLMGKVEVSNPRLNSVRRKGNTECNEPVARPRQGNTSKSTVDGQNFGVPARAAHDGDIGGLGAKGGGGDNNARDAYKLANVVGLYCGYK